MNKDLVNNNILVTGAAGFIGFYLSKILCQLGYKVTGIDNLNDYNDVSFKQLRLDVLLKQENFRFQKVYMCDGNLVEELFQRHKFQYVVNMAAQAEVKWSQGFKMVSRIIIKIKNLA